MRTQSTLVVVLVAVITTTGFVPVGSAMGMHDAEPSTGETVQAVEEEPCVPHPPIHIEGNEDFLSPGSGVIAGAGTEQAPYIIAGWCIDGDDETWDDVDFGADQQSGIVIENTDAHVLIVSNTITNHDYHGVRLKGVENAELRNNTITNNGDDGVYLFESSDNNVVENNTITNNYDHGVFLSGSSDNVVRDNTITDNRYDGVDLKGSSDNNVVENNTITDNRLGVFLVGSSDNVVRDNTITDNDYDGVELFRSGDNVVRDNAITDNDRYGVDLFGSSDNVVEANVLQGNTVGITVTAFFGAALTGTIVHDNNIHDNDDFGLEVSAGVTVHAENNWWGAANGPSGGTTDACTSTTADGNGDAISGGDVCFDPWRTSPNPDAGAG
ncbi:hypothetical protein BRD56_00340 [Thermoplasmatales archaeon SW_10_69_26]|nr:MAG: hypothetical protein BRD56_00340 [Thermoplasmatales archaeon SW_10_69_26]